MILGFFASILLQSTQFPSQVLVGTLPNMTFGSISTMSSPSSLAENSRVQSFPLASVKILPGIHQQRQQVDTQYLLSIDPLRLLHGFYRNARLTPRAEQYGGWEKMGIEGHSLGHYLSACALMYVATESPELLERVRTIVTELDKCEKARGDGFLGGMPDADRIFGEVKQRNIRSQGFDLNGSWVPWYNHHKTLAGLLDAYRLTKSELALDLLKRNAKWIHETTAALNPEDWQKMLACEFGGMNESLADLYSITKDPLHLNLAQKFWHEAIEGPLSRGERQLAGKHGNTQIPKIIGSARLYEITEDVKYRKVAENFWTEVIEDHTYCNGGHGLGEHFGPAKKLNDRLGMTNAESCNTYNMLKLTDHLFQWAPSVKLGDYYEQAQLNHILTSEDLKTGGVTYFIPLQPGATKKYSNPFDDFSCCRGTGMENHAKYGEAIYYHRGDELFINLFTNSELNWKERQITVRQTSDYPRSSEIQFTITSSKKQTLPIRFRVPSWVDGQGVLQVGSENYIAKAGEWLEVDLNLEGTQSMTLELPMKLRSVTMPDNPKRIALFHGPTLLAAIWKNPKESPTDRNPVFLNTDQPVENWLKETGVHVWSTQGNLLPNDLIFRPFYEIQHERYSVYFDVFTRAEWDQKEEEYRKLEAELAALNARTIDWFQPGEMQSERDHNLQSESSGAGEWQNRKHRDSRNGGWFSFDLKVVPNLDQEVAFTYWGGDRRTFDVLLNGELWHTVEGTGEPSGKFYDKVMKLTAKQIGNRDRVTVRLQARPGGMAGGLFGVRVLKIQP